MKLILVVWGLVQKNQNYKNVSEKDIKEGKDYNRRVMEILSQMESYGYRGILYDSYMSTPKGVKLIEFNARFDQKLMVLDLLQTDLFTITDAITTQSLNLISVEFSNTYVYVNIWFPRVIQKPRKMKL